MRLYENAMNIQRVWFPEETHSDASLQKKNPDFEFPVNAASWVAVASGMIYQRRF